MTGKYLDCEFIAEGAGNSEESINDPIEDSIKIIIHKGYNTNQYFKKIETNYFKLPSEYHFG